MKTYYSKTVLFIKIMAVAFLFQSYTLNNVKNNPNSVDPYTTDEFATVNPYLINNDLRGIENIYGCELTFYNASASGPTYMPAGTNTITWNYTGNVPDVQSITWWYKKVNNGGIAPVVIGNGSSAIFSAVADTYYSDNSYKTSDFEIYVVVSTTSGAQYTSPTYIITKKGKYKLVSPF